MELHIPEINELRNQLADIQNAIVKMQNKEEIVDFENKNMVVSHVGNEVVIKYRFMRETLVRRHIAADFLGVRIKEIDELIKKGLLTPDGRKRFRMKELLAIKELVK